MLKRVSVKKKKTDQNKKKNKQPRKNDGESLLV